MQAVTIESIHALIGGELIGNTTTQITAPEELDKAVETEISIIGTKKYERLWANSKSCCAIVGEDIGIAPGDNKAFIKVKNPDLAMSKVLELFAPAPPVFHTDIHPSATIDPSVIIGTGVKIGANVYIGPHVTIGADTLIYPNVTVLDHCTIGAHSTLWPGVIMRERCHIGNHCILHANASIGADGFGFRPCPERGLAKIPQIGNVVIGNYVEIGANSCVDRGKFSSTIIGDGCKIDNLVQIGHNCNLGKFCIMAGASGLAGSVTLGDGVIIGGSASIKDHTTIGAGAVIGAGSGVTGDVEAGKTMLGYPAVEARDALKQWAILKRMVNEKR
jgi:UDP-3-O-[3-hydroxymyristoyl] glucosamine N-acyltransferase